MSQVISGLHHVTAIASDPQRNLDFYIEVLGLRLVKRTVNFDDPGTYHFYFGDESGSPGTIRDKIYAMTSEAGATYFISQFSFGDLSQEEVLHSVDIFAREMMPRERVAQAVTG